MSRTALFVIDIQNDLANNPETEIPHATRIRDVGAVILSKARAAIDRAKAGTDSMQSDPRQPDLDIFFVQHHETPEEGGLVQGNKAWELVFEPRDESERLVEKTHGSAFESNPQLAAELKAKGIDRIVAFGLCSDQCVKATSEGALAEGFKVQLLQGAHSTYDCDGQKAMDLEREVETSLQKQGVEVIPWEIWEP